ncbi:MAG: PIN domain-containing protein [Acidobacteria bacterium]|nr:MAG: PIN domain-containing protein [Acidobacteriota bacterium]
MGVSRIFWDTNLFVYLIEDYGDLTERVVRIRERMLRRRDELYTSALTLGEILVKPLDENREDLAADYELALTSAAVVIPFDRAAARRFATIRRDRSVKPPDAIQLACASQVSTDLFITNDDRLSQKVIAGVQFISSLADAVI